MIIAFDTQPHQIAGRVLPPLSFEFEVFDFGYEILPTQIVSANTGYSFFSRQKPMLTFECKILSNNELEFAYLWGVSQLGSTLRENGLTDNLFVQTRGWEYYEEIIKHTATGGIYTPVSLPSQGTSITVNRLSPTLYGKLNIKFVKQTSCGGVFEAKFREAIQESTFICSPDLTA